MSRKGITPEFQKVKVGLRQDGGALPPPLAGEGWGEGVSTTKTPPEEKTLTRAFSATSPASGRGVPNSRMGQSILLLTRDCGGRAPAAAPNAARRRRGRRPGAWERQSRDGCRDRSRPRLSPRSCPA